MSSFLLTPLPVDEKAVSWTWRALAMGSSPLPVEEKALSWTWCAASPHASRSRCDATPLAPSAALAARDLMAPKRPYTAVRLQQAASASADDARSDHPTAADLSCEYLWLPLLSV